MDPLAHAAHRTMRAVLRAQSAAEARDQIATADARTSVHDANIAFLIARGYDMDDITPAGLRRDRAAYESVRTQWQRAVADGHRETDALEARAAWLTIRPEWADDWFPGRQSAPTPPLEAGPTRRSPS